LSEEAAHSGGFSRRGALLAETAVLINGRVRAGSGVP
jgi:hypothetical protein